MKRSPIVTTRDARLSLWTSIVESQLKKRNPDLSIKEIRNLPQLRGVYAQVSEAAGKPMTGLSTEEKKQQTMSKEMYEGASTMQLNVSKDIQSVWKALNELANLAVGNKDYGDVLADYGIRTYSDEDYGNWAAVAVSWVVAINAKDWNNKSGWEKAWQAIKDLGSHGAELVTPWLGQASDTAVQQYLAYRKWHDSTQGQSYSDISWKLPNNAKVVMLGDWGTSLPDAKALLKAIWAQENPDAFIHLGDIYYSGTTEECQDNFLSVFTEVASDLVKPMVPIFTMPGNHEYYSFGDGFFWLVDHLNSASTQKQPASYFRLQTADAKWQFLAMDTGQDDNNPIVTAIDSFAPKLMGDRDNHGELAWHVDKLQHFSGNTILLSHHQLFSRNAVIDKKVNPYFSRYLHSYFSPFFNKIAAWFWGHEHSFAIYEDGIYGLAKGRLLGSSSYEEMTSESPYDNNYPLVPYADFNEPNNSNGYYDHTCAVFDFTRANPNDDISVKYYTFPSWGQDDAAPDGAALGELYNETIGASTMKSQSWSGNNKISDGNLECQNTPSLCTDGNKIYMVYRGTDDNVYYATFSPNLSGLTNGKMSYNTSHSPCICINPADGSQYVVFSDKGDSNKLSLTTYKNGKWSNAVHVNDGNSNTINVGCGISSVWMGSKMYVAFVQDTTNNIVIAIYDGSNWSYHRPSGNPESNDLAPGLAVSNNVLYMVFADANNNDHIACQTYTTSGGWGSATAVNNGCSSSDSSMAYPKAHGNISATTEADGKITAVYRGKDNAIDWLTFDPGISLWYGGVSLPRIGSDKDVPMTSESAGVTGLSNGLYLCFRGKQTNDIRWVQRTDA